MVVNRLAVHQIWKREGLAFPTRRLSRKIRTGQHLALQAEYPNHIWTYDFIFDQTSQGTPLKILTLTDEFTCRSLATRCGTAFTSMDVKAVLKAAFKTNGIPTILRSDNGPEFIAHDLGEWLAEQRVIRKHIDPGKPWQNGIAESFHCPKTLVVSHAL
ncbi:transposase InsO family protein [Deinococcus sp. UYEF24]